MPWKTIGYNILIEIEIGRYLVVRILFISFVITLMLISSAFSDELYCKNGDIITGKLISLRDGKITFETENLGAITIDVSKVKTISTDERMEIHLKSGEVIFVAMAAVDGGLFAPESPEARIYQASDIKAIYSVKDVGPSPSKENQPTTFVTKNKRSGVLKMDASLKDDKAFDNISTKLQLDLVKEIDAQKIAASFGYKYGERIDKITKMHSPTEDSIFAVGQYDFSLNKRPFGYVSAKFESDKMSNLDARLKTTTGVKYDIFRKPNFKMNIKSDAKLDFEKGDESDWRDLSASFGWNLEKKFSKNFVFLHSLNYIPESRDFRDLFIESDAELKANITKSLLWNLKVQVDYDAEPLGLDKSEILYTLGLEWVLF